MKAELHIIAHDVDNNGLAEGFMKIETIKGQPKFVRLSYGGMKVDVRLNALFRAASALQQLATSE